MRDAVPLCGTTGRGGAEAGRPGRPRCRPNRPRRSPRPIPPRPAPPAHPEATRAGRHGRPPRPQWPLASHPGDALGRPRNNPPDEEDPPEQTATTTFTPHVFKTTLNNLPGVAARNRFSWREGTRCRPGPGLLRVPTPGRFSRLRDGRRGHRLRRLHLRRLHPLGESNFRLLRPLTLRYAPFSRTVSLSHQEGPRTGQDRRDGEEKSRAKLGVRLLCAPPHPAPILSAPSRRSWPLGHRFW